MEENYDDRVTEWWPLNNGNLAVKLKNDAGVDDEDIAQSINQMLCHLGSYVLAHSKRLISNDTREEMILTVLLFTKGIRIVLTFVYVG